MESEEKPPPRSPSARDTASPLSALFFWYTLPLFREGCRRDLRMEDLHEPRKRDRSRLLGDRLQAAWRGQGVPRPSLRKALVSMFGAEYAMLGLLVFFTDVFGRLAQPQLLGGLLRYFRAGSGVGREEALLYAGGLVLVVVMQAFCFNHYLLGAFHSGMRMRAATCSLIFRKALSLSQSALGETAAGQVVNLLSNDVSRFDFVSTFLHYFWVAPLGTIGAAYLMYREVGWPALVGVATVFAFVPLQMYTGKLLAQFRKRTAALTDERVRFTDEVVSGIRVIKMYAWERPFEQLVRLARRMEVLVIRKTSFCRAFFMTIILSITRLGLFSTMITLALTDETNITTDKVFVTLAYFNMLANIVCIMFIRGVAEVSEALVSISRLEVFLHHEEFESESSHAQAITERGDEQKPQVGKPDDSKYAGIDKSEFAVEVSDLTARWDPASPEPALEGISLQLRPGELLAVVGPVGAGKSSLLHALLGELRPAAAAGGGRVRVRGRLSYAAQQPWLFAASVRRNILFGEPFRRERYERVLRACALEPDLQRLPHGDRTAVGPRGAALSGGQRARVALARAVYREADVYLLDDPLSAVDAHVGRHLFEQCVCGLLAGRTRVLVTHQIQYLPPADRILLLDQGRVAMYADFAALAQRVDYAELLAAQREEKESGEEAPEGDAGENSIEQLLRRTSSAKRKSLKKRSDSQAKAEVEPTEDRSEEERKEESSKGRTGDQSPFAAYLRAGSNPLALLLLAMLFLAAQTTVSSCDWFVAFWSGKEEARDEGRAEEDLLRTETYVYVYAGLVLGMLILALSRSLGFYWLAMRCSERLHNSMFASVIRTHVRFFDLNPPGRILNRFSKDMGTTDEQLPISLLDSTQIILQVTGSVVVSVITNYLIIVPIVVLALLFWLVRRIYLSTSRNIKRLEGIAKSPVFSHLHTTLQGLTTVRGFRAEKMLMDEFDSHQDLHTSAWYMFITASHAFAFSLDAMVVIYIAIVSFVLIFLENSTGSDVGLIITQAMTFTGLLQWGVRQSAEAANHVTAVERVVEYSCLETEPNLETAPGPKLPDDWPSKGALRMENVHLSYGPNEQPALRGLSLAVRPAEKLGVVGRTGAGKSSLLAALFRLAWRLDGRVLLDGVDTAAVPLHALRSRLAVIPQEPVLFSGTLRRNLDPFNEFDAAQLWSALEQVELRDALSDVHGLETHVAEAGANFSVGQRQLVCLARALLRDARVLVLDEATANVDPQTDALIQRTIRAQFARCTVLTVAHRLHTVMDSDRVLVMEAGRVAELDHPHLLLQNAQGQLRRLVDETGKATAQHLAQLAKESYEKKNPSGGVRL